MTKLRILHCPENVAGQPQRIAVSQRQAGYHSHCLSLQPTAYFFDVDEVLFSDGDGFFLRQFKRFKAAALSIKNYDVINYNFGMSLCPNWARLLDVFLAHKAGKIVAVTYQGDDARQGDYCHEHYPIHFCREVEGDYYTAKTDRFKRRKIKGFDRYADLIYAVNPDIMNVLPSRTQFMPYANIDPREWTPVFNKDAPKEPHIVHAPSHRGVKGTKYILEAFERLKAEGVSFRYSLVENLPNAEARKIYETADLLIDQLLAGYYGGLSVELMALGKPVICYMRESDMHFLPDSMWRDMPVINADPTTIYTVLKEWLTTRKGELRKRGEESRQFVEKWHDPQKIAVTLLDDYKRVRANKLSRRKKA